MDFFKKLLWKWLKHKDKHQRKRDRDDHSFDPAKVPQTYSQPPYCDNEAKKGGIIFTEKARRIVLERAAYESYCATLHYEPNNRRYQWLPLKDELVKFMEQYGYSPKQLEECRIRYNMVQKWREESGSKEKFKDHRLEEEYESQLPNTGSSIHLDLTGRIRRMMCDDGWYYPPWYEE